MFSNLVISRIESLHIYVCMLKEKIFAYSDGEAVILKEAMSPGVIRAFKESSIDFAKGEPSATADHQAADAGPEFRDLKSGIMTCQKEGRNCKDEVLEKNMKAFWADFSIWLRTNESMGSSNRAPPTSAYKEKVQHGLNMMCYVMQNGYMSPKKTRDGFLITGQHVVEPPRFPIPGYEDATIDFDKIMSKCYQDIDVTTKMSVREKVPLLVNIIRDTGRLKLADYRDCGILPVLEKGGFTINNRDDSVLWQQHSCVLTHDNTQEEWTHYKDGKDPALEASKKARESERAKLTKLISSNEKKVHKKATQNAEKLRVSRLQGDELSEHKRLEKQRLSDNKTTKALKRQRELQVLEDAKRKLDDLDNNQEARNVRPRLDDGGDEGEDDMNDEMEEGIDDNE